MWGEALSLLEQADRLHRQFFRVAGSESAHAWEPPVDVVETASTLQIHIALPGVAPETITIAMEPGGVVVSALRPFPCRETGAHIHRIEIPYGRFERRIVMPLDDPYMPLDLVDKQLADGVLTLTFRRKEGA
jgi:HSP20 family molecular chaperone IbpA